MALSGPHPRRPHRKLVVLAVALALFREGAVGQREGRPAPKRIRTGDAVTTFAGNARHTAIFNPAAQDLNRIHWSVSIDLNNTGALAHYGAPLITAANTVITPVKIAGDLFQVRGFDGAAGTAKYTLATDYILPPYDWIPMYQPVLAAGPSGTRLYYPGAGGTVFFIDNPDSSSPGTPVRTVFYTTLANYEANAAAFNAAVFVNTPITADSGGNIFFGFRMVGTAPAPLSTTQGGFARVAPDGSATYVLAGTAAGDAAIGRDSHNSAPALSNDEQTLYVVVKEASLDSYGYLLGLDTTTLARKYRVFLKDPRNGHADNAVIADSSTSSPTVAPDNDVYFGILGGPSFLLRFSGDLAVEKAPGAFGWDSTAAIVPKEMVPSYTGPSSYLVFCKYNNYADPSGGGSENGVNRIAIFDPGSTEVNPRDSSSGVPVMREVLTIVGPTPDAEHSSIPTAVREWCINTAAVNPATHSVFTPSEDGHLYRWDLATNSLSQAVQLTAGIGEPYVPTVIGPDGTVYTLNGGTLFALGGVNGVRINLSSSVPGDRSVVAGHPLTFTAAVANAGAGGTPTGTVTFQDTIYFVAGPDDLQSTTTVLCAGVALDGTGHASCATAALSPGTHFITALYSGDVNFGAGSMVLVQRIHQRASVTALASSSNPSLPGQSVTFTATVGSVPPGSGTPTGMVTFQEGPDALAQVPLDGGGAASFSTSSLSPRSHAMTAIYSSDSRFASSGASLTQVVQNAGPAPFISLQQIASSLGSVTSITNAGDSRLFLTIQTGTIRIFDGISVLPTPFLDVTPFVSCCGERGLLSVAFHPQYASNGLLFLYTTNLAGDIEIVRYRRSASDPNTADPSSRTIVLTIPHPTNSNHNGGQLQFGPEGYLYIGTGDGGSGNDPPCNAQNDDSPLGKMLRIDVDLNLNTPPFYAVPGSNPMAAQPFPRNLTWAKGLRNPFRFSFDRAFGDLWIGDVGQDLWEEVDFRPYSSTGGENYGWKIMEGNHCGAGGDTNCPTNPAPPACGSPLFQYPVYEYGHGGGNCSIIGGYVYRGSRDPSLAGSYVYGDLCSGRLWIGGQLQTASIPGLQTFGQGRDGELYAATGAGALFVITHPHAPAVTSFSAIPASPQHFGVPITWTAAATGGIAPLQYRFWRYKHATGVWTIVQDYGASNTFSWTPGASDVGAYDFEVWVRNLGSTAAYDASSGAAFNVLGSPASGPPTVNAVTPNSGQTSGGGIVTISGTNLTDATSVEFGGAVAAISANTPTQITVTAPPHSSGAVNLSVTGPGGSSVVMNAYLYAGLGFFTVPPCRVADTRDPPGSSGGPELAANTIRTFPVTGLCGIPSTATAVAIDLAVFLPSSDGDLRVYPAGETAPLASSINFRSGIVRAGNAVVPLGAAGEISVQCDMPSGSTHFFFDVYGYFQ
jgi:glucose/arabinose dehydrogenase